MEQKTEREMKRENEQNAETSRGKKRNLIFAGALLFLLLLSCIPLLLRQLRRGPEKLVVITQDGKEILRVPLEREAKYKVVDGTVTEIPMETELKELGEEAYPAKHHCNLIEIRENTVSCPESNCSNQVCVGSGRITGSSYDFPIVCLPHGLMVTIVENG